MTPAIRLQSVFMMLLGMTLIVTGDTAGKLLLAAGFTPFFVAATRFFFGALMLAPFMELTRADIPNFFSWRVILRAGCVTGAISCILTALSTEPIANVFGAFFIGPLLSYFLSAILLKEAITWRRTVLILLGFVGVVLVVKPGFGMTRGMGFAVLAGCFYGCFIVATRWLAGQYRPRFLLISQLMIGACFLMPMAVGPIPDLNIKVTSLLALSALSSGLGNLLLVVVSRTTPANVVAPLVYTQLLAATTFGILVFGDWPDILSFIGLCVILFSGLASFWLAGHGK